MIQVGDVLREKYRIDSSIGKGGMGEVFAAVDVAAGRRVAVKVVSRTLIGDLLMARLQREAIAAVRVRSDFVPQVVDVDTTEEGEVFLVMELLHGQTLAERLKHRGHLSWEEVCGLGADVLRGLIDAHAAGVIHRDLKPSNIFVELPNPATGAERERAKILDFGVCKLDAPDGEKLTTTGESVGTVAYMAPEQIRGASKVDERADLYSFATVVFEALTGRLAHDASGQMAMLASKLERAPARIGSCALVALPYGLDALVARNLARSPEERMGSATELLTSWEALGPPTVPPPEVPLATSGQDGGLDHTTPTSLSSGTMTHTGQKQSRIPIVIAVGALAMSIGVIGAMLSVKAAASGASAPALVDNANADTGLPARTDPLGDPAADPPTDPAADHPGASALGGGITVEPLRGAKPPRAEAPAPPAHPLKRYTRPMRPTIGATKRDSSEPHIVDKPRY